MNNVPSISIQTPCHENWEGMSVEEQGRYCESCNTHVQDFTNSTTTEIQAAMDLAGGQMCGRVNDYQVDMRDMMLRNFRFQRVKVFFFSTLFVFGTSLYGFSQQDYINVLTHIEDNSAAFGEVVTNGSEEFRLTLSDEDGNPLSEVIYFVYGDNGEEFVGETSILGELGFELDKGEKLRNVTIKTRRYKSKTIVLDPNNPECALITMERKPPSVYVRKHSPYERASERFERPPYRNVVGRMIRQPNF